MTTGWCSSFSVASPHLIAGSKAVNHGYPRITSSLPRFVTRKRSVLSPLPVRTVRSVYWVIAPSWLWVPSTFQIRIGWVTSRVEIWSRLSNEEQTKLSVAPESMRTCHSAVACADLKRTGIRIERYLLWYTFRFKALAQAAGFKRRKNPSLQTVFPPWDPVLLGTGL